MSARLNSLRVRPLLYVAAAVVLWGSSFVATKSAMRSFSPMTVIWLRMVIASLIFLPFWRRVPRPDRRPGDAKYVVLAVLFIPCLFYLMEGYALHFTTSGQAGIVSAIFPLFVAVAAWVLLKERLAWQLAAAITASIVAVALLSLSGTAQASAPNPPLGNLLEFGAMGAAAGSTLVVKHLSARYDAWFITGLQAAVGVVFFAPLALAAGLPDLGAVPLSTWAALVFLGGACGLGAFGLYNSALKMLPANRAALAVNAAPVVAIAGGWLVLGETVTWVQVAASAAIVGAVAFAEMTAPTEVDEQPVY